jgi:predicted PurR-regulated permease PerM
MANRTRLPVSFVFIVLLVGEKYLGVWGLLIGVPIFIFLMTVFGVSYSEVTEEKIPIFRKLRKRMKDGKSPK